jgi:ABC-2 type transport system ATP-binding protein
MATEGRTPEQPASSGRRPGDVVLQQNVPGNTGSAISTRGLTKRYGSRLAVDNLDLDVRTGEIFGFLGPNGAGKTTTMRMLLGLIRPSAGEAKVLGMETGDQLDAILMRTGAIIESPTFYPYLTGSDNLRVVARLAGAPNSRIDEVLSIVELTGASRQKFKKYSLGMKQRLAVASTLMHNPDLLILDEPANGLDPAGIVEMRGLMTRLKGEGKTIFVSSHVLHEIQQVCDRIAILNKGRIVAQGPVAQLLESRGRLRVGVSDPDKASQILHEVNWIPDVTREADSLLVTVPPDRASDVNRALADHGIYAHELSIETASLEQYFLDMTAPQARTDG